MRNRNLFGVLICSLSAIAVLNTAQLQPPVWNNPPREAVSGVVHKTFHSASMNTPVGYNVLLPPGYEATQKRYPVVYVLHGLGGNENAAVSGVAPRVIEAVDAKILPPVIVVFVNGADFTWYADSPDKVILGETAFIRELVPHVDATYRTIAGRAGRAIEGMSMGGFGALVHAMKHADMFGSVVAYAPALLEVQETADGALTLGRAGGTHIGAPQQPPVLLEKNRAGFDRMFGGSRELFGKHNPWDLVRTHASELKDTLAVRIVIGTADGLWNANNIFHQFMIQNGYGHDFIVVPGVGHELKPLYDAVGVNGMLFHVRAGRWQ